MNKIKDLTNKIVGKLKVLRDTGKRNNQKSVIWECQCSCENKTLVEIASPELVRETTISCGCALRDAGKLRIKNLLGNTYGRLTVISFSDVKHPSYHGSMWLCQCSCENKTIKLFSATNLSKGTSNSCGCLRRELGINRLKEISRKYRLSKGLEEHILISTSNELQRRKINTKKIKQRDKYKCVLCGVSELLVVHHIEKFSDFIEARLDPSNLITVCKDCHVNKIHKNNTWLNPDKEITYKLKEYIRTLI